MRAPCLAAVRREIARLATPERRAVNLRYFKTGPGEYGEGDEFVGLTVPQMRDIMKRHRALDEPSVAALIRSPIHEERCIGIGYVVERFRRGDAAERARRYRQYVGAFRFINNWDLVDGTAEHVVGPYLEARDKAPLWKWARSKRLWDRRIAMLAQPFIPEAAGRLLDQLGVAAETRDFAHLDTAVAAGTPLPPPAGVFPRWTEAAA